MLVNSTYYAMLTFMTIQPIILAHMTYLIGPSMFNISQILRWPVQVESDYRSEISTQSFESSVVHNQRATTMHIQL